jgi:hypothetical protein
MTIPVFNEKGEGMRAFIVLATAGFLSTAATAQTPLMVKNTENATVEMAYSPVKRSNVTYRERFLPNQEKSITVRGEEPFFVSCYQPGENTEQMRYVRTTYLKRLAESQQVGRQGPYKLALTFVGGRRGPRTQIMSAKFLDPDTDEVTTLFDEGGDESDFVNEAINRSWDTVRVAPDGEVDDVELDFGALQFNSGRFQGKLRQMAVGEDEMNCYILGRWWIKKDRQGDVYFTVSKQNPEAIAGYSTLDGERNRHYRWNSR